MTVSLHGQGRLPSEDGPIHEFLLKSFLQLAAEGDVRNLKHRKNLMHSCWLEDGVGRMARNVRGF